MLVQPRFNTVSLIGYRATGKSTLAQSLAKCWGWVAADSDRLIESAAGKTISQIFVDEGEPGFRQREHAVIGRILESPTDCVLATGGGAILNSETRERLKRAGPVVWLTATPDTIAARLAADAGTPSHRPPLTALGGMQEIVDVLSRRQPLYEEVASIRIATNGRSPSEILEATLAELAVWSLDVRSDDLWP